MRIRFAMVAMVALALVACQSETTITGSFGESVVSGQVVLGGDLAGGSPAGIIASVPGTGMEVVLAASGQFLFSGVPEDAEIHFMRASDGIDASYRLGRSTGDLVLEVTRSEARRSRGRPITARTTQLEGLIVEIDLTAVPPFISVNAAGKGNTVAILDEETIIRKGDQVLTPADLAVGDRVHIMAQPEGETFVAKSIFLQNEAADSGEELGRQETQLEGLIVTAPGVAGTELVVDAAGKGPTTVAITPETLIRKGNRLMTPDQLEEGWRVHVKASTVEGVLTARLVIVQNMHESPGGGEEGEEGSPEVQLEGKIVSIAADLIVVDAAGKGATEVAITEDTEIRKGNERLEWDDLKADDLVHVKAIRDGESLTAREIKLQKPA